MTLVDSSTRSLGSITNVGPLAFGLWRYTNTNIVAAQLTLEAALDVGMNLVDNADVYGFDWGGTGFGQVEEILGSVLAKSPGLRDRIVLATKGGIMPPLPYDSSKSYLRSACEASLSRMGVDVIDLYQIHRPDLYAHPADVAATLTELRIAGKIREVGVSNHTPAQVAALQEHLGFPIATNQPEFSAHRLHPMRDGTLDQCMQLGITPIAWSPLAGGSLATGDGVKPGLLAELDRLAQREGVDRSHIALAFVLAHPSRPIAIVGSQNIDRITDAVRALNVHLDRADVYTIVQASEGVQLP
jgi:predicted oxidoreductase